MIKNKTALITGSTKGIGSQIGIDLLQKNYFVYFNYANDVESAQELQSYLDKEGYSNKFVILQGNLSIYEEAQYFLDKIHNNLDCIVFNVGITDRTTFGEINIEEWDKVFRTNLTIPFFMLQGLKDRINENGRIIFVTSISGIIPDATSISYGVSKASENMLVKYLAKEFAPRKITINAIAPGYVMTDWHKGKSGDQIKRIANKSLLKRFATPKEIAKSVMMVIENDYITGQIIRVDGGFGLA